jgi:hypothetical protein
MTPPSPDDRCLKVTATFTDQHFGYEHWRAAQFCADEGNPRLPAVLVIFDTEEAREGFYRIYNRARREP